MLAEAIDSGGGTPWPVIVIGGLVIIAGLFAVRSEFGNFRARRAERRR